MQFSSIIGQEEIKTRLRQTVSDKRISHAQLFVGPEGAGSLAMAIAYAQFINCEKRTEHDSCGTCPSCVKYQKIIHPDLHFVFPVATTNKVKKDPVSDNFLPEWREMCIKKPYFELSDWLDYIGIENKQGGIQKNESSEILRKLNLKTFESEYKVMIIWMAEKMNITCANKLLKILEEPPPKTLFILISNSTEHMLQTILSRTQLIKIPRIDEDSMTQMIKSMNIVNEEEIKTIVHNAEGNYNKALMLVENMEAESEYFNWFTSMMRLSYMKDVLSLNNLVTELSSAGRETQKSFLEYSLKMIRENFILNQKLPEIVHLYKSEKAFSDKFHAFITERNIETITEELNLAHYHIERNGNPKIIFFDLFMKMIVAIKNG